MNDKDQVLNLLLTQYEGLTGLLDGLSEAQASEPKAASNWSVKDDVAHLWAWQQRSIARLAAALQDHDPDFPRWNNYLNPDSDESPDPVNHWIYETYHEKPWDQVYADWKAGYQHLMELGQAVPEADMTDPDRYVWMEGQPLTQVLQATYEHHVEHSQVLEAWLGQKSGREPSP